VITFDPSEENTVRQIAEQANAPFAIIGRVGGHELKIIAGDEVISARVSDLESAWRGGLSDKLHARRARRCRLINVLIYLLTAKRLRPRAQGCRALAATLGIDAPRFQPRRGRVGFS
jgi:hypothetical protein